MSQKNNDRAVVFECGVYLDKSVDFTWIFVRKYIPKI